MNQQIQETQLIQIKLNKEKSTHIFIVTNLYNTQIKEIILQVE